MAYNFEVRFNVQCLGYTGVKMVFRWRETAGIGRGLPGIVQFDLVCEQGWGRLLLLVR